MSAKIRKNLTDAEMFAGWQDEETFETAAESMTARERVRHTASPSGQSMAADFVTPELSEKLGQALLEQKLALYKEGLVDYKLKVSLSGRDVVLTPVPAKTRPVGRQR